MTPQRYLNTNSYRYSKKWMDIHCIYTLWIDICGVCIAYIMARQSTFHGCGKLLLTQFRTVISAVISAVPFYLRDCNLSKFVEFLFYTSCLHMAQCHNCNCCQLQVASCTWQLFPNCCIVKSWNKRPISGRERTGSKGRCYLFICIAINWISVLFISCLADPFRHSSQGTFSLLDVQRVQF